MGVDVITFAVCLVPSFVLGYRGYRHTREQEDCMVAGRRIHPAVPPMPWQVVDPLIIALPLSTAVLDRTRGAAG